VTGTRSTALTLVLLVLSGVTFAPSLLGSPRVRVHGTSAFDVTTRRQDGRLSFAGTLKDDTGAALPGRHVQATVSGAAEPPESVAAAPCSGPPMSDGRGAPGRVALRTDARGWFCLSVSGTGVVPYKVHFEWAGDADIDGTVADVTADPSRRALELEFNPIPTVLNLDEPTKLVGVDAKIEDDEAHVGPGPITLFLLDERQKELGRATVSSGKAVFKVARESLGPPGRGDFLRVRFGGDGVTSPAERVVPVVKQSSVVLVQAGAVGPLASAASPQSPSPVDPEEGIDLPIAVRTRAGQPVPTGVVEATFRGEAVGSAPVEAGLAKLRVIFPVDDESKNADLDVRYVSDAPWYLPADSLGVTLRVSTGHPVRRGLLLASFLGTVLWLALSRRPPKRSARKPKAEEEAPRGKPGVAVLRAVKDARVGWSGRVVDAHDGIPLPDVEVRLERASFEGIDVLARTKAGARGRFELRYDSPRKGDRLAASAPFHQTLEQSLPGFGELEIALVLRKRALLDRLVAWAKTGARAGRGEPTPGYVARHAPDPKVGDWARAVERASFGPEPLDEQGESAVDALAPRRR
jgi:hypothetical protein